MKSRLTEASNFTKYDNVKTVKTMKLVFYIDVILALRLNINSNQSHTFWQFLQTYYDDQRMVGKSLKNVFLYIFTRNIVLTADVRRFSNSFLYLYFKFSWLEKYDHFFILTHYLQKYKTIEMPKYQTLVKKVRIKFPRYFMQHVFLSNLNS